MTCTWTFIQHSRTGRYPRYHVALRSGHGVAANTQRRAVDIRIGIGLAGIALAVSEIGLRIATGRLDFNLRSLTFWRVRQLRPRAASIFLPHRVELPIGAVGESRTL
jgi:hypothetical protein